MNPGTAINNAPPRQPATPGVIGASERPVLPLSTPRSIVALPSTFRIHLLVLLLLLATIPLHADLSVHFIDVGQGSAILLESEGAAVLVDAGDIEIYGTDTHGTVVIETVVIESDGYGYEILTEVDGDLTLAGECVKAIVCEP